MKVIGAENLTAQELNFELQRGGRYIQYQYCISALIVTFKRFSDIYFVKAGENKVAKGLPWTALSLVAGWWGIPWGPIFTVQALYVNLRGGRDITEQMLNAMQASTARVAVTGKG